jgi:hypothetical protein
VTIDTGRLKIFIIIVIMFMVETLKKIRLNLKSWRGFISLLAFLFLFHAAPSSYTIFHTIVHQEGIEHHHTDLPQHHSQDDHSSGKSHDPLFQVVSIALHNTLPALSKGEITPSSKIGSGFCLITARLYLSSPAFTQKYFFESGRPPPFSVFKVFHSNRAPPSA